MTGSELTISSHVMGLIQTKTVHELSCKHMKHDPGPSGAKLRICLSTKTWKPTASWEQESQKEVSSKPPTQGLSSCSRMACGNRLPAQAQGARDVHGKP